MRLMDPENSALQVWVLKSASLRKNARSPIDSEDSVYSKVLKFKFRKLLSSACVDSNSNLIKRQIRCLLEIQAFLIRRVRLTVNYASHSTTNSSTEKWNLNRVKSSENISRTSFTSSAILKTNTEFWQRTSSRSKLICKTASNASCEPSTFLRR